MVDVTAECSVDSMEWMLAVVLVGEKEPMLVDLSGKLVEMLVAMLVVEMVVEMVVM